MKTQIIAISALSAFFVIAGYAQADGIHANQVKVPHWGDQQRANEHFQGSINDDREQIAHLQRSDTNNNAWDARQQAQIDNNTAWNDRQEGALRGMQGDIKANAEWDDRQEGVIRQNRGRLDENDARNQRQDASIDNAHARIGGVVERADKDRGAINDVKAHADRNTGLGEANQREVRAVQQQADDNTERSTGNQKAIVFLQEAGTQLSSAIQQGQQAHAVTDKRSINNAERLDGAEGAIRETNAQLEITDGRTIQNADAISAGQTRTETVNRESIQRDQQLSDGLYERVQYDAQQDTAIAGNREYAQSVSDASVQRDAAATIDRQRIESGSVDRDNALGDRIQTVDGQSRERDQVIAHQVDYNESVNAAYRRQSAAQFEQHGAAIESNTQAIANERNERQQMGKDLNAGVAGALAAAAAQFDLSYYGAQLSVSGGSYRGESAAGLSVGAKVNDYVFINGGVVHDSRGHQGFNAAANFKF